MSCLSSLLIFSTALGACVERPVEVHHRQKMLRSLPAIGPVLGERASTVRVKVQGEISRGDALPPWTQGDYQRGRVDVRHAKQPSRAL